MVYQLNGQVILRANNLKQGKAKFLIRPFIIPSNVSSKGRVIFQQANERFEDVIAFTTAICQDFFNSQSAKDAEIYPYPDTTINGSNWVQEGPQSWIIPLTLPGIFTNVNIGKPAVPRTRLQGNCLAPVSQVQAEIKQRNREALVPNTSNGMLLLMVSLVLSLHNTITHDLTLLCNWPDPDSHIRLLGEDMYLGEVRVKSPHYVNTEGQVIHPSEYSRYLVPGTRVAVLIDYKTWDITSSPSDPHRSVNSPSHHCVPTAVQLQIIPDDDNDIRILIHCTEAEKLAISKRTKEQDRIAEEYCEARQAEEASKLAAAAAQAKAAADKKVERAEHLKTLWRTQALGSSSTPSTPSSSTASSLSTPSPAKRVAADGPPSTPSPPKRRVNQTAHMTSGGKMLRKGVATSAAEPSMTAGQSTWSKDKAKTNDAMDIDTVIDSKGKSKAVEHMDING
ncbi:hypothetical protein BT96DRAFT_988604 [Gymnopus androsaceus JB14]|uniref:Uncharacterized protein n=1 Tax=Gymnopus androsaceus JB14 TaxID=1447944 RepID=A0A6A4I4B4_9AGAR|nr:hypothetical protein BT96DRAFT_988604 [Gymnopus androsaceus JB14]